MTNKWVIAVFILSVLSGCSKPPDLDSPCAQFGKFCPQYPINEDVIHEAL